MTSILKFAFAGSLLLLASACATGPAVETEPAAPVTEAKASNEGEELICRSFSSTGSRVRREKVCMTAEQWDATNNNAQEYTRGVQEGHSMQPGGQTIQTGR